MMAGAKARRVLRVRGAGRSKWSARFLVFRWDREKNASRSLGAIPIPSCLRIATSLGLGPGHVTRCTCSRDTEQRRPETLNTIRQRFMQIVKWRTQCAMRRSQLMDWVAPTSKILQKLSDYDQVMTHISYAGSVWHYQGQIRRSKWKFNIQDHRSKMLQKNGRRKVRIL